MENSICSLWDIYCHVASIALGAIQMSSDISVKCDGDHGGPSCADLECWSRPSLVSPVNSRCDGYHYGPVCKDPGCWLSPLKSKDQAVKAVLAQLQELARRRDLDPTESRVLARIISMYTAWALRP